MVLRLLLEGLSSSVAGAARIDRGGDFRPLFAIMTSASAAAFFCASRTCLVLSATNLPATTRLGFFAGFAGFAVGVGEVAYCVISPWECAAWVSPCECALSGCSVDILQIVAPQQCNKAVC